MRDELPKVDHKIWIPSGLDAEYEFKNKFGIEIQEYFVYYLNYKSIEIGKPISYGLVGYDLKNITEFLLYRYSTCTISVDIYMNGVLLETRILQSDIELYTKMREIKPTFII